MSKFANEENPMSGKIHLLTPVSILAFLAASPASAHSGSHATLATPELLTHILASPFHLGILMVLAFTIPRIRRKLHTSGNPKREVFHE
jgi:hypothetical protein